MKKFETPEIKVVIMEASDVIAASESDWEGENGGDNTGWN